MTPKEKAEAKEKAQRLVETYSIWCWNEGVCDYHLAKILALIAVDEMLANAGMIWGGRNTETGLTARDEFRKYWQEVKLKIQKL